MVVTCVAFTRSLPATDILGEFPIEAAATAHLDPRYLAGARVRTGQLPDLAVEFRGRPIRLHGRALHHRRVDLLDLVLEVDDEEAAAYLAAFDRTATAVAAELFHHDDDRCSIAALHTGICRGLLGRAVDVGPPGTFRRIVFHRGDDAAPEGAVPGASRGHLVSAGVDGLDVHADTTVLADERLAYAMVAGLSARAVLLVDDVTRTIDTLAVEAGDPRCDLGHVLERAAETQRRAVVIQREVSPHRLLAPSLRAVADHVDEALGVGALGHRDLETSVEALQRLTDALFARSVERRTRAWERYGLVALVLLTVLTLAVLIRPLV